LRHNYNLTADKACWGDIGLLKVLKLKPIGRMQQSVTIGSSISNFSNADAEVYEGYAEELPTVFRLGSSYSASWYRRSLSGSLRVLRLLAHLEYQDILGTRLRDAFKLGGEISIGEILALRLGYYWENIDDHGSPDTNKNKLNEMTYGIGINVPVHRYTRDKIPMDLSLDIVRLDQPDYTMFSRDWDEYWVVTICGTWHY
jgi:hypothetical protein